MSKPKILVLWSIYYKELAEQQLEGCLKLLEQTSQYDYLIEKVEAGTYEIPFVIRHYQTNNPMDAYLPLSLLLKGSTDHYDFILAHVKECFIQFAMEGIAIGNGIISAPSLEIMQSRVFAHERSAEALKAIDYLLRLKNRGVERASR